MTGYGGCKIDPLENESCRRKLDWIAGNGEGDSDDAGFSWLLAHCHDGVVWGKKPDADNNAWQLSSKAFPDLCPPISSDNLLEMRLFGTHSEILIWRVEDGFKGRHLKDENDGNIASCMTPFDEDRILLGNHLMEAKDGFSRVSTGDGRQQAVPLKCSPDCFKNSGGDKIWPLKLTVRHYFEQETETGAVRVAVTRLVNVR